ncbi:alpha/beta fold hydrolase [Dickeya dianthicola]|uniref:thioesterase II family protein n=1 Tax=Dickeya dianthicola TaxID=204039 RepID=UPI001F61DF88|nr:alpha/beta fold hydrolase [Dickeya dianthicola]MCI4188442.1 alpha/beta fold hydrolase [Dickeya dianthicola]
MNKIANVICIPFAGAGASSFREFSKFSDKVEFIPIQLPGREKKFLEPLSINLHEVVDSLVQECILKLDTSKPTIIFGHSLGAILAYEITRHLVLHNVDITSLVVSGSPGPWDLRTRKATGLSDDEFIKKVQEFADFRHASMSDPTILELVLPILKADVQMHEEYEPGYLSPIAVSIKAIRGNEDLLVSDYDLTTWSKASTLPIESIVFRGGHMYIYEQVKEIVSLLEDLAVNATMAEEN